MSSSAATKSWGRIDFVWNYGHNTTSWEQIIDVSVSKKYKETSVLDLKSLMMRLFSSLHKKIAPLSFVRERNALVARFAMHSHLWIEVKFSFPELWWFFFCKGNHLWMTTDFLFFQKIHPIFVHEDELSTSCTCEMYNCINKQWFIDWLLSFSYLCEA